MKLGLTGHRLLAQPNQRYPTGQRTFTLLKIMLDTALLSSEAINLKWKHVNLISGKITVKGGKGAIKTEPYGLLKVILT